jgi:proteasome lid subunit RPN8/RPN11
MMSRILRKRQVVLNEQVLQELKSDVYRRATIEACGVLRGIQTKDGDWFIEHAHPLQNVAQSETYFEFAPEELLIAELTYPEQIVGVYHSHPTGFPQASHTDRQNMLRVNVEQQIPWVWLIIRGPFAEHASLRETPQLFEPRILAYYYYTKQGLQRITVICR